MIFEIQVPPGRRSTDAKVGKVVWVRAETHAQIQAALHGTSAVVQGTIPCEGFTDRVDYTLPVDAARMRLRLFS